MTRRTDVDVSTLEPRDVLVGGPMILGHPERVAGGASYAVITEDGVSEWPRGTYVAVVKWYDGITTLNARQPERKP